MDSNADREVASCLGAYDLRMAFPSLDHNYLCEALEATNIDCGFVTLYRALYSDNYVIVMIAGESYRCFIVSSGVIQGCPASAVLFVIAIDPRLSWVQTLLESGDFLGSCADDILTVVRSRSTLSRLAFAFDELRHLTNLALACSKTCFVPIGRNPCAQLIQKFRNMLIRHIPAFSTCKIAYNNVYLGCCIGPRSGSVRIEPKIDKRNDRLSILAKSSRAADANV